MSELRKGQRVRVTYEATYDHGADGSEGAHVVAADFSDKVKILVPPDATIEPIEDLRPGDVYRSADGLTVVLADESSIQDGEDRGTPWIIATFNAYTEHSAWWLMDSQVKRPLTLLVRDGQPVTS